jgi:transposase
VGDLRKEDFWFVVATRSKDETESGPGKAPAEQGLRDVRRQARRHYSAEEKIRTLLEGLRGEENISELYCREGIVASMHYDRSKEFLEAGKRRLAGDTARAATSGEVKDQLKKLKKLRPEFPFTKSLQPAHMGYRLCCSV